MGWTPAPPEGPPRFCRYKDYREPPWSEHKYDISKDFWAVLAARLAFVIVFQVRGPARLLEGLGAEAPRMLRKGSGGQELARVRGLEAGGLTLVTPGCEVLVTPGPGQGEVPDPPELKEGGDGR